MSYRDYFQEIYNESPMRMGMSYGQLLDNSEYNKEEAEKIVDKVPKVDSFIIKGTEINIDVYLDSSDNSLDYFFVEPNTPEIRCTFIGTIDKNNNYFNGGVWNRKLTGRGMARYLVFEYFLKKYNSFTSDRSQYTEGELYWKKLIKKAQDEGHRVTVLTPQKEFDIDDANKYWGQGDQYGYYRIRIYAKN